MIISKGNRAKGFTLVELMVVLLILGVFVAIALPGFATLSLSTRVKSYANELFTSVLLARSASANPSASVRQSPVFISATAHFGWTLIGAVRTCEPK